MEITAFEVGPLKSNCYLVYEDGEAALFDAGDDARIITDKINSLGLELKYIILTHAHFDHIMALAELKKAFPGALICLNKEEEAFLSDNRLNLSWYIPEEYVPVKADILISDGDEFIIGKSCFRAIHTPGHSCGSTSFLCGKTLISGDTLFRYAIGRCDHPTGNIKSEVNSIINILFKLSDDTVVYPGHGKATTIGQEKQHNDVYSWIEEI